MADEDLIDPNYIMGDPNREYDPTANTIRLNHDNFLGNEPTLVQLNETTSPHGHHTLVFGELLETGYDWGRDEWESYTVDEETLKWLRPRINEKIERKFWFREIGIDPIKRWQSLFIYTINETLDELGPLYKLIKNGLDLLDTGINESKEITVNSDFPQARLKMTQEDYASNSLEHSKQNIDAIAQSL